jgi:hypothetical protein
MALPTIPTQIWLALRSRIVTLSLASTQWPQWPVAYPGSDYTPQGGKPFISVGRATSTPIRRQINRPINDRTGYLTLTAVMPIGQDPAVYEELAGKIAEHFTPCIYHNGLTLTLMGQMGQTAHVANGYRDGSWWRVPVNIPWRTWA